MGLDKEQEAVLKLLRYLRSERGLKCDNSVIKGLLLWAWKRELIPSINVAFEVATWDNLGKALWGAISGGGIRQRRQTNPQRTGR